MNSAVVGIILVATLVTAAISGVFGMAGGLILMGVLASYVPVATAMVLHGFIQLISNFSRAAFLAKQEIQRGIQSHRDDPDVSAILGMAADRSNGQ